MAKNTGRKRVATKHIRDGIKSKYKKDTICAICGTTEDLEFHHYTTVSLLLKKYAHENGIPISTDEEVLAMRDQFYELYWHELVEDAVTLCNEHHLALHRVYSQEPPLNSADKQRRWVEIQKNKHEGLEVELTYDKGEVSSGCFSKFISGTTDFSSFIRSDE